MTIRPLRNNNPGDLVAGEPFKGVTPWQLRTPEQKAEHKFDVYDTPRLGFRAFGITLINYQWIDKKFTLEQIVCRFAPGFDHNNDDAYILHCLTRLRQYGFASLDPKRDPLNFNKPGLLEATMKSFSIEEAAGVWVWKDQDCTDGANDALSYKRPMVLV